MSRHGIRTSREFLLLEVLVAVYVDRQPYLNEPRMASSRVARREWLSIYTCDLMILGMPWIMFDAIDAGVLALFARLE